MSAVYDAILEYLEKDCEEAKKVSSELGLLYPSFIVDAEEVIQIAHELGLDIMVRNPDKYSTTVMGNRAEVVRALSEYCARQKPPEGE